MYQKRQAMLQKYDQLNCGNRNRDGSRFLPDPDELQHHHPTSDHHHIPPPPPCPVESIKASIFGRGKSTNHHGNGSNINFQPTLTQMMGSTTTAAAATTSTTTLDIDHHEDVTAMIKNDFGDHDDNSIAENDIIVVQNMTPPPKAHRVESSVLLAQPVRSTYSSPALLTNYSYHHYGSSIWDSFRYGIYDSSWDSWFSNTTETSVDETIAVNHLLQLLPTSPDVVAMKSSSIPPTPPSHLSTRAETLVDNVVNKVCTNPLQLSALEHINPNWKENIRYAIGQKDEVTIHDALENVCTVQKKLRFMKEQIIANIDRQQTVLDVYEETLRKAKSRFTAVGTISSPLPEDVLLSDNAVVPDDAIAPTQGFFLSQHVRM